MYNVQQDKYLEIKLPTEPSEKTLIQAVGIPERLYYRLDAELGPERDALKPTRRCSDPRKYLHARLVSSREKERRKVRCIRCCFRA